MSAVIFPLTFGLDLFRFQVQICSEGDSMCYCDGFFHVQPNRLDLEALILIPQISGDLGVAFFGAGLRGKGSVKTSDLQI